MYFSLDDLLKLERLTGLLVRVIRYSLHCYFSAAKHREAAQWCEQGMKLLKHLGTLKSNYEQQVENSRCRQVGKI